ncbi:MAG: HlyD family efflux transporter periplasmic adaptor subunit, partial [Spirochaetaceae bacterium]|nr:HlyD family efflux transporter periplasmic adaptor subunit [Spirochaetaceae bacterium]
GLVGRAAISEIPLTTKIAGRLTPASSIAHPATAAGNVSAIYVNVGQSVKAGDRLFSVVRDDLSGSFVPAVATARISGIVSSISVKADALVKSGDSGVTIIDGRTLYLKALLSDKDAMSVEIGAKVEAAATGGTSLSGVLIARSPEPDYQTGLFTATIEFSAVPGAFPGQYVTAELRIGAARGIFVQQELLQRMYGRYQLWIVDAQGLLESRRVSIGAIYGDRVLITEGLAAGDRLLLKRTGREKAGQSATGSGS